MAMREVTVENGKLRGVASGVPSVTVFKGVPYAAPPVGELRWREPQPCPDWDGVYDACRFRAMAPQANNKSLLDRREFCGFGEHERCSEDCLYVNIWTPAQSPEERLPVLFYIHGGGFVQGYSYDITVDGDSFALQGCILVTVEYRLGVLGFLAHPEMTSESGYHASGNFGLLDQAAAIRWVHRNIAAFGGNPDNITVFGQSAGAMSTTAQICTPLTKGLIARAVIQSAGGYTGKKLHLLPRLSLAEAERFGESIFAELGVSTLEQARKLPMEEILRVQAGHGMVFAPIVDGYFFPQDPDDIIRAKQHHDIPVILGYCADEAGWFRGKAPLAEKPTPEKAEAFEKTARSEYGEYAERYLEACGYFDDPVAASANGFHDGISTGVLAYCELSAQWKDRKPTYLYYFNREIPGDAFGAFHAGDLWYTFNTLHRSWRPFTGTDFELARKIGAYLCNFAKSGDPNGDGLPHWEPYTAGSRAGMALGEQVAMLSYPGQASTKILVDAVLGR